MLYRAIAALFCLVLVVSVTAIDDQTTIENPQNQPVPIVSIHNTPTSKLIAILRPVRKVVSKFLDRSDIKSKHLESSEYRDTPWSVLNIPGYANYTDFDDAETSKTRAAKGLPARGFVEEGWHLRAHALLYKKKTWAPKKLDNLVNRLLIRARVSSQKLFRGNFEKLPQTEADSMRKNVKDLAVLTVDGARFNATFANASAVEGSAGSSDGGTTVASGTFTNEDGIFDEWLRIPGKLPQLPPDSAVNLTLKPVGVSGARDVDVANSAISHLVAPRGLTVISDIDDVLRVAEVWNWKQAIIALFARPFEPWLGMAEVYKKWDGYLTGKEAIENSQPLGKTNIHWHYATDAADIIAQYYIDGTLAKFPSGSFDFRWINVTKASQLKNARYNNIKHVLETFPERKYILVADTTSSASMQSYPRLMKEYPEQVQCILMRDTEATEPADYIVPNTRPFLDLQDHQYFFFRTPNGDRAPTLTDLPLTHLSQLAALNQSSDAASTTPDGFAPYIDSLSTGCFDPWDPIAQSMWPSTTRFAKLRTFLRGAWYRTKCDFIPRWKRPNKNCPFDRRPGAVYWDGHIEGQHDE